MIHEKAIVETEIGEGTNVWAFTHIMPNAKIGNNCNIGEGCFIEADVSIGDNVTIKNGVYIWNGVIIEDDCFIGPNVTFINDRYPRSKQFLDKYIGAKICKGASIGANSTIHSGIVVGVHSMIGAGSVVTRTVKDFELSYGNPTRHHGYICICSKKLIFNNVFDKEFAVCTCGLKYRKENGRVVCL